MAKLRLKPAGLESDPSADTGTYGYRYATAAAVPAALLGFLVVAIVSAWKPALPAPIDIWLRLLPFHGCALAAAIVVLRQRSEFPLQTVLDLRRPSHGLGRTCKRTVLLLPLVTLLAAAATLCWKQILQRVGIPVQPEPLLSLLSRESSAALWGSVILATLLVAPLAEEILFRVVLYETVRKHDPRGAAIVTSLLFAGLHFAPEALPALFVLGLFLQRERRRARSLWGAVFLHAGFNAVTLTLAFMRLAL